MPPARGKIQAGRTVDRVADIIERNEGRWLNIGQVIVGYRCLFDGDVTENAIRKAYSRLRDHPTFTYWEWRQLGHPNRYSHAWQVRCPE